MAVCPALSVMGPALITAEYALVGLVPISATFTYLLVQRQVLDMRFYIPRLAAHSLYFSLTLVLFLLTTVWGSIGYAVLLFILLALLTAWLSSAAAAAAAWGKAQKRLAGATEAASLPTAGRKQEYPRYPQAVC